MSPKPSPSLSGSSPALSQKEWELPKKQSSHTENRDSKNQDVTDDASIEAKKQHEKREKIRHECRSKLEECASDISSAMTKADVNDYIEMGMAEEHLTEFKDPEEKTEKLREHLTKYVPNFIRQTREAGSKAMDIIGEAERAKWISSESAKEWQKRLKRGSWEDKRTFIEKELPQWRNNWKEMHDELEEFKKEKEKLGLKKEDEAAWPAIAKISTDAFAKAKYPQKRTMLDEALAALGVAAKEGKNPGKMTELFKKADAELQSYVSAKFISADLKAKLLRSIFKHDQKDIESFLNGKGPQPLSELREGWVSMRQSFDKLQDRRQKEGTPRSFHFVHLEVFIRMSHGQKQTYLEQADDSFEDFRKENYNLLLVRNAFAMKDWEEAEHLINEAKKEDLNQKDKQRLTSMERFLAQHRVQKTSVSEKKETPTDGELVGQARDLFRQIPPSEQKLTMLMLRKGASAFRCKRICDYNHQWCREHRYLDDNREQDLLENAQKTTAFRAKHGHNQKGLEANDVTNPNAKEAIRDQENISAPQVIFGNESSADAMAEMMDRQKNNRDFWYWTTSVPLSINYEQHLDVIKRINPQLQRIAYEFDKRKILFTAAGEVEYADMLKMALPVSKAKATDREPQYSTAI